MKQALFKPLIYSLLIVFFASTSFGAWTISSTQQNEKPNKLQCSEQAFRAMKPFPEIQYDCEDQDEESEKSPARRRALQREIRRLEQFTTPAWWATRVEELNACDSSKQAHVFTEEEAEHFRSSYIVRLFGDSQTRLIVLDDPCVKYSYGTQHAFVLQRSGNRTVATQVVNGYYSRADVAIGLTIADTGSERIVEIWTGSGGLNPSATAYLFAIDKKTGRAVPKKLIKDGKTFSNAMTSCYALGVWSGRSEFEVPDNWEEMSIVQAGKLAKRFYVYAYNYGLDKLERDAFVWNGQYYVLEKKPRRKRSAHH